ncbi:class I SAM-dependent methyltransferase [Listeria newyorkensis]|uniref:Class I SAM-dependent methyltransferase n=1 Tax=Listeria newyorkensis TaxID=1497681 RepID=A0A841YTN4_9LIST|nr:methyltransferase domain-containing protein [Listeria newyorkensis]MBC1456352.1 class I SAM-dependent methyltransferase [Listeria newyorkensis]
MEENVFETIAKKYDSTERIELANIIAHKVREELVESKDKTLIDYGSGTGLIGLQIADSVKNAILIDSSENMVEIINNKVEANNIQNVETFVADFTKDTMDIKADIVLVSLVLLHIPDTKIILEKLYKTLHTDGKLIIIDFDKNPNVYHPKVHNGFVADELKALLTSTGFKSTNIQQFHHGEKVFMKQDATLFIAVSKK